MSDFRDYINIVFPVIGTIGGAVAIEWSRAYYGRQQRQFEQDKARREELRSEIKTDRELYLAERAAAAAEIASLEAKNDRIEAEMNEWREKWWVLKEKHIILNGLYQEALRGIRETVETVESEAEIAESLDESPGHHA